MPTKSFEERIKHIEGRGAREMASARVVQSSNSDRERLVIALGLLERNGVRHGSSYPVVFKWIANWGFVLRPLHFWRLPGLVALVFTGMSLILLAMIFGSSYLSATPRPIALLLEASPVIFLGLNFGAALIYAAAMKAHAKRLGLPRWDDL